MRRIIAVSNSRKVEQLIEKYKKFGYEPQTKWRWIKRDIEGTEIDMVFFVVVSPNLSGGETLRGMGVDEIDITDVLAEILSLGQRIYSESQYCTLRYSNSPDSDVYDVLRITIEEIPPKTRRRKMMKLKVFVCRKCATPCYVVTEAYSEKPIGCLFMIDNPVKQNLFTHLFPPEFEETTKDEMIKILEYEELP